MVQLHAHHLARTSKDGLRRCTAQPAHITLRVPTSPIFRADLIEIAFARARLICDRMEKIIVYNCIYIWLLVVSMFLLLASCCRLPTFPTYIAGPGYNGQSVKKSPGMTNTVTQLQTLTHGETTICPPSYNPTIILERFSHPIKDLKNGDIIHISSINIPSH